MPTVLRVDRFEVVIRTDDHEPPHVHVFRAGGQVKIWLEPVTLDRVSGRLGRRQLSLARGLVWRHREMLLAKWREIHG